MKVVAGAVFLAVLAASTASAQVQLSIRDGRVTLSATNATVRQILNEWSRIGQTKIVNAERIPGAPLTLQFTNVPEHEALDILLRSVTGYMAAPRPVPATNLSQYDRILVLPTAAPPRVASGGTTASSPVLLQRPPVQQGTEDDDQPSVQAPRGPLFPTFQLPQPANPQSGVQSAAPGVLPPQQPTQTPAGVIDQQNGQPIYVAPLTGGAAGTPRPGMVQPVQPGVIQPAQPVRPTSP